MEIINKLRDAARQKPRRLVLPEGDDARTVKAAAVMAKDRIAQPILLGDADAIRALAGREGVSLTGVEVLDPAKDARRAKYAALYHELRKHKGVDEAEADRLMKDPLFFGTMMLHVDEVDGFLSGAAHATADTIRPALQVIKPAPGVAAISSFFIMVFPDKRLGDGGLLLMADCAINIDPAPRKLALIGISTARMAKALCGLDPKVAFLSFSTMGSAQHELVDRVKEAVRIAKEKAPDLAIDGEMQADAAIVPEIGKRKAPDSKVAGQANVLVFPDLQAANIGYKLVQRLAGAEAIGPILQGFAKPVNDLSRGASVDDIVNLGAVTCLQADPSLR